jgi:hypothetical protein
VKGAVILSLSKDQFSRTGSPTDSEVGKKILKQKCSHPEPVEGSVQSLLTGATELIPRPARDDGKLKRKYGRESRT